MIAEARGGAAATGASLGQVDEIVGYHLRRASAVIANDFARTMAGTGMRPVLFAILSIVSANPGINQGAAGRMLGIQRANMVSLINELTGAGWIDRRSAHGDRRAFSLTITDEGTGVMARSGERILAHEDRLLTAMTASERRLLIDLLGRIEALED